jgi:hypothetical protein
MGVASVIWLLTACVAQPPARPAIATLPPLDPEYSRVVVGAGLHRGDLQTTMLSTVREVGPVYFNGRAVGSIAQDEYFVLDAKPDTYEVSCSPMEPAKNAPETRPVRFVAGETKYLVCDMASPRPDQWPEYRSRTYVEERSIDVQTGRLVSYRKFP